jgi:hypothetical protein
MSGQLAGVVGSVGSEVVVGGSVVVEVPGAVGEAEVLGQVFDCRLRAATASPGHLEMIQLVADDW